MISIRQSKNAISGLRDMIKWISKFQDTKKMDIVEIGCYVGDSTKIFAENFRTVYAVDPWINGYDDTDEASYKYDMKQVEAEFDKNMKPYHNVIKIKETSENFCKRSRFLIYDLVYIDALHTYPGVSKDYYLWLSKIKEYGFIAGHDYQKRFKGVMRFVDEIEPDATFKDTSWIKKL